MMAKRILSVLLAVLLIFAASAVACANGDAPAKKQAIFFNAESVGWEEAKYVGFHIWEINGKPFSDWGGKAERGTLCKEYNEHGEEIDVPCFIWQFDFAAKGITLEEGKQYGVIFYNDKGGQTYNLLFDTTCFGDTADCDTTNTFENPEDSEKIAYPAYWRNQDPKVNGPELKISSIGNVVGSCLPRGTTTVDLMTGFLVDTLENARKFSDMTDQEIIDNIGEKLGMTKDDVAAAIVEAEVETGWTKEASVLPAGHPAVETGKIYFDAHSAGWDDAASIGFHIWEIGKDEFFDWGAKAEKGEAADNGVWSYDPAAHDVVLEDGKQYGVIFYNDKGGQTYNLLFDKTCLDDTAFCSDEEIVENPVDSEQNARIVYWKNQDPYVNGPELEITSIGTVVGMCIPRNTSAAGLLKDFLTYRFENARAYSGLSDHQIIENIAKELQMTAEEVLVTIQSSSTDAKWDYEKSDLAHIEPAPGNDDMVPYTVDVMQGKGAASGDVPYLLINYSVPPEYQYGEVTLTAVPAEKYQFVGWEIEGEYEIDGDATLASAVLPLKVHTGIAAHAKFEAAPAQAVVRGDYDRDGEVTILDATRVQRMIADLEDKPDEETLKLLDADQDGEMTILDATRIQRVLAELCDMDGNPLSGKDSDELPFVPA